MLDADIKACFDEIDHDVLMADIGRRVVDRQMAKLLRCWLRAGIFEGGVITASGAGARRDRRSPRCWRTSRLHRLDQAWQSDALRAGTLIRYADDFVVVCRTAEQAHGRLAAGTDRAGRDRAPGEPGKDQDRRADQGQAGVRFPGVSPAQGGVLEMAWTLVPAALALDPGDEKRPGEIKS